MVSRPHGADDSGGPESDKEDDAENDQPLNSDSVPEGPVPPPEDAGSRTWGWSDDPHADDPFEFPGSDEGVSASAAGANFDDLGLGTETQNAVAILDALPVGVIVLDSSQNLRYANREHAELLGSDLSDFDGIAGWLRSSCRDATYAQAVVSDWREHIWQKQVTRVFSLKNGADQLREIEFAPRLVGDDLVVILRDVTDSRQAEDALRAMDVKFDAVFQPAEPGIALIDRTGRFLDVNAAFSQLLGRSRNELRRMALADCVAFSDIERIKTAETKLEADVPANPNEPGSSEDSRVEFSGADALHFRPKEGDTIPAEAALTVVRSPLGKRLYSVLHLHSDATSGRNFEHSRAQSRALLEAIPDLILVLDRAGMVTDLMPANGGDWRGVMASPAWKNRPIAESWPAFSEAAGDRVIEAIEQKSMRAWRFSEAFEANDDHAGREVHYSVRVAPCEGDGAVAVVMDVTEEAEAREAHARQGLAFRHLDEAILVTNLRGRITDFNAAAERIFGYELSEIAGTGLAKLYAEPGQERALNREVTESLNEHGRWAVTRTFYRKDGTTGLAEVVFLPVEESGTPRSLLGIHREITERSPDTSAAEKMQHRWRNQLQEINGLLSLEMPQLGGMESGALAKVQARLKVVGRLHDLARSLEEPVDLSVFARHLAEDLRRLAGPEVEQSAPFLEVKNESDETPVTADFENATTFGFLFAELALALYGIDSAEEENEADSRIEDGSLSLGWLEGHPMMTASVPAEVMPRLSVPVLRALVEQLRGSLNVKNENGRAQWMLRFPAQR